MEFMITPRDKVEENSAFILFSITSLRRNHTVGFDCVSELAHSNYGTHTYRGTQILNQFHVTGKAHCPPSVANLPDSMFLA